MEAKDTVMSDRELLKFELRYSREDTFYWGAAFDAAIKVQAEISFKAGIGEAVEWVEQNRYQRTMKESLRVWNEDWQAKLKEWGV